jgi:hypothetical protein
MNALIQVVFFIPGVTNNAYLMEREKTNDQFPLQTELEISRKNL